MCVCVCVCVRARACIMFEYMCTERESYIYPITP